MSIHVVWALGIPILLVFGSLWVIRYLRKRVRVFLVLALIAFALGFLCGASTIEITNLYASVVGRIPMQTRRTYLTPPALRGYPAGISWANAPGKGWFHVE